MIRNPLPPVALPTKRHEKTEAFVASIPSLGAPSFAPRAQSVRSPRKAVEILQWAVVAQVRDGSGDVARLLTRTLDAIHRGRLGDAAIHIQHAICAWPESPVDVGPAYVAVVAVCNWLEREVCP